MKKRIAILGAGSWGVTLAHLLHSNGHKVRIWEFSEIQAKHLAEKRQLAVLPNIIIPDAITITNSIEDACANIQVLILAVPSQYMRSTINCVIDAHINVGNKLVISVTKGIENNSFLRMSQVVSDLNPRLRNNVVVLSGPSHAEEVSRKMPTAIVAACSNSIQASETQKLFMNKYFRVYTNPDTAGVEFGGALKNIMAIGCGICDGLGLGDNTKAALLTRGLTELTRLGVSLGAQKQTFSGLSGIGDLVVTCTSKHSRNRLIGEKIGSGIKPKQALKEMVMVAEGVPTTKAVYELSKKVHIDMPITEQIYAVLYKNRDPEKAITKLMIRKAKPEN